MYAMQSGNFALAHSLLDRGADATAKMAGGPCSPAIRLCSEFNTTAQDFDIFFKLAVRLLDSGADPDDGLMPSLAAFGATVRRPDLIKLMLDRGADPDRALGNSGRAIRELVKATSHRYSPEVLVLLNVS